MSDFHERDALVVFEDRISEWLAAFAAVTPVVEAIDRGAGAANEPQWYVRMAGEEKDHITVWLTLGQRTLRYEAYVMPAPLENIAAVFEMALRRNARLVGAHFAVGVEDALFLRGELPLAALSEAELDRILGSVYAYVEQCFPALIRLGYASRFAGR
ncbi:MAG: YbjN domain-containing protein [Ilumatobacteraceae bacterium]